MNRRILFCLALAGTVLEGAWALRTSESTTCGWVVSQPRKTVLPASALDSEAVLEARGDRQLAHALIRPEPVDSGRLLEAADEVMENPSDADSSHGPREDAGLGAGERAGGLGTPVSTLVVESMDSTTAIAHLRVDPVAALEVIRSLPPGEHRDELLTQAVTEWGARDSKAALEWVRQVLPMTLRNRLVGQVALGLSNEDPRAAAEMVSEEMQLGPDQGRAAVGVLQRWVQSDLSSAAAWVERFPQAPMRQVVVDTLLKSWWSRDPIAARGWVFRLQEASLKVQATKALERWSRASMH